MRTILMALTIAALGAPAWAGVSPQQSGGQQAMSGAKIKPASQEQNEQTSNEPSAEKKDVTKDDKH
jgi:hypothetical protein